VGIAERTERMIIVALGVLAAALGWPQVLPWALALVAVLAWITVVQRIWHVRGQLHPSRTAAEETP
jgi:CDP-diacylglycerol--glycerol-3-phosphate 3-phosphatidyltransferase